MIRFWQDVGRVWALGLFLLGLYGIQVWSGLWVGDFWEHSAAVTALSRDLLHPGHPLFAVDAPHYFYSPYALVLASIARLTGLGVIAVLALAGALNLALLFTGTGYLIRRMGVDRPAAVWFYAWLLWLFLWGHMPWHYSGFLHFGVLFKVLPYPSSFATGLTFWILAWCRPPLTPRRLAGLSAAAAAVLLTHPLTFLFLSAGVAGFGLAAVASGASETPLSRREHSSRGQSTRDWIRRTVSASRNPNFIPGVCMMLLIPGLAVLLALPWPYYPVHRLVFGVGKVATDYSCENAVMFRSIPMRTWPIWLCLPLALGGDWRHTGRRAILGAACLLGLVYGYGVVSRHFLFGRVISPLLILMQLLIAERLAALEGRAFDPRHSRRVRLAAGGILLSALAMGLAASRDTVLGQIVQWRQDHEPLHRQMAGVMAAVPDGAVVLSDRYTANLLPTFGAKTVFARFPQTLVADAVDRRRAVSRLYAGDADPSAWRETIARWGVTHVLVNREIPVELPTAVLRDGQVIGETPGLLLVALPQAAQRQSNAWTDD